MSARAYLGRLVALCSPGMPVRPSNAARVACAIAVALAMAATALADEVELTNGMRYEGRLVQDSATFILFRATVRQGSVQMKLYKSNVAALTVNGQRRVIREPASSAPAGVPASQTAPATPAPRPAPAPPVAALASASRPGPTQVQRSRQEVDALIEQAGQTPPDWLQSTPLRYPQTLDLTWNNQVVPGWNTQRKIGCYFHSVIKENPNKWREGVRLLMHTLTVNKDNPRAYQQSQIELGNSYHHFFSDYTRAAWWYRQARVLTAELADCYWQLGNREMAVEVLTRLGSYDTRAIRVWANIGEVDRALRMAEDFAGSRPHGGYLLAGDICRHAGRMQQAMVYYQKVLDAPAVRGNERNVARARAGLEAARSAEGLDLARVADGTYQGTSTSYLGPLTVEVVVKGGRIESARVVRHVDDLFFSAPTEIPRRIVQHQGIQGVEAVTGATVTSEAILNAAAVALRSGMK